MYMVKNYNFVNESDYVNIAIYHLNSNKFDYFHVKLTY